MVRTADAVMAERKMLMLAHLEGLAGCDAPPCLSYSGLARSMELSKSQVRRICKLLQKEGSLMVEPRYLENGAQLENAYALTPVGRRRVSDWRLRRGSHLAGMKK